jgi:hypothetical protein
MGMFVDDYNTKFIASRNPVACDCEMNYYYYYYYYYYCHY